MQRNNGNSCKTEVRYKLQKGHNDYYEKNAKNNGRKQTVILFQNDFNNLEKVRTFLWKYPKACCSIRISK